MSDRRIPVALLGATGSVGQRFVSLLAHHPLFRLTTVTASERSAGLPYREATRWVQATPIPQEVADLVVAETRPPLEPRLVFSALDAAVAGPVEAELAGRGHLVVSNARSHRMEPGVPLLVPEVNPEHLSLLRTGTGRGRGAIITNPNCSTIGVTLPLRPLRDAFGIREVRIATMQAVSGAGIPGVSSMEIMDNVIPFISGEEGKLETETLKILGQVDMEAGHIRPARIRVSAQCNRVPVVDGHTACVWVELERVWSPEAVREALESFTAEPQKLSLPSAPPHPVVVLDGEAHPQPRLHRDVAGGMAVTVGRIRRTPTGELAFVTVSHNTIRGAAGGAILCAELALARGLVPGTVAS
ncbi:MAG: aspartate-semialdehyde dehydrogenase [Gemmatimonadales bacterium]|nr:MAG: aspartate-semialdehyde dehydrogenase [Gemmatimonadales bacterium]